MDNMRTVVYTIKVDTDDAKKGGREMAITMKTMSSDAKATTDKMHKLGETIGKEYGANVKVAEDVTRSMKAQLRQAAGETNRSQKNFNLLSKEYKLLSARVGRTADQQEQLNALYRLGSNATLTQKKATLELVKAYQLQRAAGSNVQKSFRGMRGQMQNFGYQMQDVAVQVQMGTNAMTILSQQGSQLAAGFGPTGAIIGAGIAFGGMLGSLLIPMLSGTTTEVDKLTEKMKELVDTTGITAQQAELLIDAEVKLIKETSKEAKVLDKKIKSYEKGVKTYAEYEKQQRAAIVALTSTNSKVTLAVKTEEQWTASKIKAAKENRKNIANLQTLSATIESSQTKIKTYESAVGQGVKTAEKWKDSNSDLVESLTKQAAQIDLTSSELLELKRNEDLLTLTKQKASEADKLKLFIAYESLIVSAKMVEQNKAEAEALTLKNKAEAQALKDQNAALAAAKKLLNTRAKYSDSGKLDQLKAEYNEEKRLLAGHSDALIGLEKDYESRRIDISGTAWEKYIEGLKNASMDFEKLSADMLENSVQNLSDGIGNAIVNSEDLGDALQNTFKSIASAGISALIQMGVQRLIYSNLDTGLKAKELTLHTTSEAAKTDATLAFRTAELLAMKAVYVANVAARGGAETSLGALNAAASIAAIPIVGPAMAPGAAAAFTAMGTGLTATAVGFAGAFDKGGVIPQGMTGIVSEYGDELVNGVLVKGGQGGTRVTGREDTAKIVNNNAGGSNITINSSGNVSAEAIARATIRALKKPNKILDTAIYDSTRRGSTNRGKRFA